MKYVNRDVELHLKHTPSPTTEVTIKALREKLREQDEKLEQVVETRCKERERQLLRQQAEAERVQKTEQHALAGKLAQLEGELATARAALVSGGSKAKRCEVKKAP